MNGILKKTAVFLLGLVLVVPCVEAQQRTSGHRGGSKSEQVSSRGRGGSESNRKPQATRPSSSRPSSGRPANTTSRPGNSGSVNNRPGNNHQNVGNRPGNNGNHNQGVGNRPGNNHQNVGNRPGNNGNHNQGVGNRPGNNHQNVENRPGNNGNHNQSVGNRPGHNGNHNQGVGNRPHRPDRPVTGVRPGHNARPPHNNAVRPGHNYRPPYVHRPTPRPWHRPVPPPAWRPRPGAPVISAIFGINFGTALNVSLNFLLGHGYTVSSYGSNAVYLSDVNQYNYYWPEATMYYGNNGLERTEFFYSTSYPDTVRYNNLYNNMTAIYGAPVNVSNVSSSLSATWFAPNQGYIRLQYVPQYSSGQLRFFTSITTGL
ncbi:MAG: hypothetical protein NC248_08540 [Bacteroides sp.]|nr:hypothetical protein [Bacteroides sp.]MCM1390018.1 hypothetical protein [Bacteroides sp.]